MQTSEKLRQPRARQGKGAAASEQEVGEESSVTSVDQATAMIRQAILSGRYAPGERLKVADLSAHLGFSPMPLREALRKLEGEGLVEVEPNRGATVRRLDQKFVEDLFELSGELRIFALRRGLLKMTLDTLDTLERLAEEYEAAIAENNLSRGLRANREFHSLIVRIGGNREVERVFQWSWEMIAAFRQGFGYGAGRQQRLAQEKRLLIEAIRRQDLPLGEAILRMQNAAAMEDLIERFGTNKGLGER